MKLTAIAVLASLALVSAFDASLDQRWEQFKLRHQKNYDLRSDEIVRRLTWEENVKFIDKHNEEYEQGIHTHSVEENHFADMTDEEFRETMLGSTVDADDNSLQSDNLQEHQVAFTASPSPSAVDWVTKGYVTSVKNQGKCGSCYTFSAAGAMEGQLYNKTGRLVDLSTQEQVDCSRKYGNHGCRGGLMNQCFRYVRDHGLSTWASYPYISGLGREQQCRASYGTPSGIRVRGYVNIRSGSERGLADALARVGPVSVAIDADSKALRFYKSGVYTDYMCSSRKLNHGVLAVGYGVSAGRKYFKIKNSWSDTWGDSGYVKMRRDYYNMCGVATMASYPVLY